MTTEAATTQEPSISQSAPAEAAEPKLVASSATKDQVISQIVAKLGAKPEVEPTAEVAPQKEVVESQAAVEPPAEEERVSPKLAKLREREAEIELAKKELEERARAIEAKEAKFKKMKENPVEALEAAEVTFQDIAKAILETGDPASPENAVAKEIASVKAELAAIKKEKEEAQQLAEQAQVSAPEARIQAAVADYQARINTAVTSSGEKFELVAAYEAQDLVYDIAREYFTRHEKILAPEEAAELAEKFLEKRLEKVISTKKLKSRIQPATKQPETKTLTNGAQSFSAPVQAKSALLDREARLQEALKRLRYT